VSLISIWRNGDGGHDLWRGLEAVEEEEDVLVVLGEHPLDVAAIKISLFTGGSVVPFPAVLATIQKVDIANIIPHPWDTRTYPSYIHT
jgi:hypothetical protein